MKRRMSIPTTLDRDHPTHLFLDTEWADADGTALVSIAIIGAGTSEFYAECDPLPRGNAFARKGLYPHLLGAVFALQVPCTARSMADFISQHHAPHIVATHANDFALLDGMLACASAIAEYTAELRHSESHRECLRLEFNPDPALQERRHHAGVDVRVLRDANSALSTNG